MSKKQVYEPVVDDGPLPEVRKTPQMVAIEKANGGTDIRLLIKEAYEETGSQKATAARFGLEQSTMTVWALRLGITFSARPVAEIRVN